MQPSKAPHSWRYDALKKKTFRIPREASYLLGACRGVDAGGDGGTAQRNNCTIFKKFCKLSYLRRGTKPRTLTYFSLMLTRLFLSIGNKKSISPSKDFLSKFTNTKVFFRIIVRNSTISAQACHLPKKAKNFKQG